VSEKELGSDNYDRGTSRRVLGTLLTWLAERKQRVFVVATANDIEPLPPELLRKGRLDEVFFVDLPNYDTRRHIARIPLGKRDLDSQEFDLDALGSACKGFSGSEIEQAIVSSLYSAFAQNTRTGTAHVLQEISRTRPLAVLMQEKVTSLRAWASNRTVPTL